MGCRDLHKKTISRKKSHMITFLTTKTNNFLKPKMHVLKINTCWTMKFSVCNLHFNWHDAQIITFTPSLTHSPEKVFIRGVDFTHCLPLLLSFSLHTGGQHSHDFICEVGGAGVRSWQHVNVREPIRGFSSVAFTHQEDTQCQ